MISDEYLKVYKKYFEKYGEKTALLYTVGSFYEIYGVDNGREKLGNAEELSRILNITLTRKSKKILENSMQNPKDDVPKCAVFIGLRHHDDIS